MTAMGFCLDVISYSCAGRKKGRNQFYDINIDIAIPMQANPKSFIEFSHKFPLNVQYWIHKTSESLKKTYFFPFYIFFAMCQ
jgi:hypothetical protein